MSVRHIRVCINTTLTSVTKQAFEFEAMTKKLYPFLPLPLAPHVFVMNFVNGCLTLGVNDAVWLAELRYEVSELRNKLRKEAGWHGLASIALKVVPLCWKEKEKPIGSTQVRLSVKARTAITSLSETIGDEHLRQALQRLART